jgi:hypothetical protein
MPLTMAERGKSCPHTEHLTRSSTCGDSGFVLGFFRFMVLSLAARTMPSHTTRFCSLAASTRATTQTASALHESGCPTSAPVLEDFLDVVRVGKLLVCQVTASVSSIVHGLSFRRAHIHEPRAAPSCSRRSSSVSVNGRGDPSELQQRGHHPPLRRGLRLPCRYPSHSGHMIRPPGAARKSAKSLVRCFKARRARASAGNTPTSPRPRSGVRLPCRSGTSSRHAWRTGFRILSQAVGRPSFLVAGFLFFGLALRFGDLRTGGGTSAGWSWSYLS